MNSICFDTETTGLHPNGSDPDEILTISIIGRDGSVLLDERFRPTVKTEWPHASAINGIYPEDVADLRYSPCARHFPSPSVTGLCAHPIPVSSVFQTGQKGLLTCTRF